MDYPAVPGWVGLVWGAEHGARSDDETRIG
jgi:hypothetical protein